MSEPFRDIPAPEAAEAASPAELQAYGQAVSGPALVPVLNDLRDLARFKILDEPASRPLWQPRLQQIEWHLSQWGR